MTCDTCNRKMDYCFYIDDVYWSRVVGKKEGYRCAHCILQGLGGLGWQIIWSEPLQKGSSEPERKI